MNRHDSKIFAAALLTIALFAAGCKSKPVQNPDGTVTNPNGSVTIPAQPSQAAPQAAPQAQSIRNPDGSISNPDGSVTYPPGSRVAQRESNPQSAPTAPVTQAGSESAAVAPRAEPVRLTVPSGTPVTIRLNGGLAASRNEVGDRWNGVLERPVMSRGSEVFAAGTPVSGEVIAAKGRGRFKGAGDLGIELTAIGREHVSSTEYENVGKGRGKRTGAFTGGGAGLGAIIGGLAGGGKGALIGGLAGAGGGAAASAYTGNRDVVIPAESVITFRLTQAVTR